MKRASTLQSILTDPKKRIYFLFSFMALFCTFHLLIKPFQLSHYSSIDFIKVNIAYNLIAMIAMYIGLIAIPQYLPTVFKKIIKSNVNRIAYLIFLLFSIGLGIFMFKIAFGYYDFSLARIGTGISAMTAFSLPIGFVAYTVDTKIDRTKLKEWSELTYWKIQKMKSPVLNNDHYEEFFTKTFGLTLKDYENKKVLDIGCGPRGSLEWTPNSTVAIGLDPLAKNYLNLHTNSKPFRMQLVEGYCENIPFGDNYFDIVTSFNSIDHVEDLQKSANEIQRVMKPGGLLLVICDVNRKATLTEPHSLSPDLLFSYFDKLILIEKQLLHAGKKFKIYVNVRAGIPLQDLTNQGVLIAKFKKS